MIGSILFLLIVFSIAFLIVWHWYFKTYKVPVKKLRKQSKKAFKIGDFKKAKESLLQIPDSESNPDIKFELALSHFKLREYDDAKKHFEQILKDSPNNIEAMKHLAKINELQGDYDASLELYSKLTAENDKDIDSHLSIVDIHQKMGNYDQAQEVLDKLKESEPDDIKVLFSMTKQKGETCNNPEEYGNIINEFKSLAGKPDLPKEFDISLAKLYSKNGQIDEALKHCKLGVEADDTDVEAYKLMGLIQLTKKDFVGSKNSLSIALNLKPSNAETHDIFAFLLCDQEEHCERKDCREKYRKLIEKYLK